MDQLATGMHLQIVQNPTKNNAPHLKRQCLLSSRRKQENQRSASCFVENNMQMAGLLRWPRLWRKAKNIGRVSIPYSLYLCPLPCFYNVDAVPQPAYVSARIYEDRCRPTWRFATCLNLLSHCGQSIYSVTPLNVVTICDCLGTIKLEFVYSERLIHHLQ